MICPGCGKNVGDHEKFCRYCGASLNIEKKKKFCGQCGNELFDSDIFCGKCGASCKVQNNSTEFSEINGESFNPNELEKTISIEDIQERWYKPGDTYRESSLIPEEDENASAIEEDDDEIEVEKGRKKKNRGWLIALAAILILLAAGTGVVAMMLFSPNDNIVKQVLHFNQENAEKTDVEIEDAIKRTETVPSESAETEKNSEDQETTVQESSSEETSLEETEEETLPDTVITMDYVDSDEKNFPSSPDDFTEVKSPDGVYTLKYPKNFFKTGSYNSESKSYQFSTEDGQISMEIWEEEAAVKNDPKSCANSKLEQYRSLFMVTEDSPYVFESKKVAESGFSRSVIAGALKSDATSGKYIVTACNNSTTYTLIINYYALDSTGAGVDYTPTGYLLDCVYRGWSISGSTYQLRTYDQYLKDEMGSKKE